ncbi:transglutaminase-like putative cysteine protease [Streptomyces sp. HB372]|nr:transglutaminase-like putative cysteine protease [Streptomyces sp. HB372]
MELTQQSPDIGAYLAVDEAIDHEHPRVVEAATRLAHGADTAYAYARAAFEFVRDTIAHSADSGDPRVTWRASEVLAARTGICHAKSIALVALLRARSIPAGLCYQRLADDDGTNPMVHGLVALRPPRIRPLGAGGSPGQQAGRRRAVLPGGGAAGVGGARRVQ